MPAAQWVCVLDHDDVARLNVHKTIPDCKKHKHLRKNQALSLIRSDLYRSVGEEHGLAAIVEHESNGYVWKSRMSGGFNVRQMVRLVQG